MGMRENRFLCDEEKTKQGEIGGVAKHHLSFDLLLSVSEKGCLPFLPDRKARPTTTKRPTTCKATAPAISILTVSGSLAAHEGRSPSIAR